MGIPPPLDPRYRLSIPDTPPELVSPDTSLSISSASVLRQPEDRSWTPVAPISPPMSNYDPGTKTDMSVGNTPDAATPRGEAATLATAPVETAPRTQLPSLSSLFGPPQLRPLQSPTTSERPGSYTSSYGSTSLDRSSSSSYFPSVSSLSASSQAGRGGPFDAKPEDRPQFPSLSRQFLGPLSPRPREHEQPRPEPRPDFGAGRWSSPSEIPRNEYSFGERESRAFHPTRDRIPPPPLSLPRREEERGGSFMEQQRTPQVPTHVLPSTSPGAVSTEGAPSKDGLGPKIWTGTHFLPRFVRSAEVPGEGLCYFYDDGSHCKSVIDGEVVNAHWGVTKAGKPRKRLAIACITCREKKIKCDPDYPRCVQCEKFGRVCKFKNA